MFILRISGLYLSFYALFCLFFLKVTQPAMHPKNEITLLDKNHKNSNYINLNSFLVVFFLFNGYFYNHFP